MHLPRGGLGQIGRSADPSRGSWVGVCWPSLPGSLCRLTCVLQVTDVTRRPVHAQNKRFLVAASEDEGTEPAG